MRLRGRIAYKCFSCILLLVIVLIIFINFFTDKTGRDDFLTHIPELKSASGRQESSVQAIDINEEQLINLTNFRYTVNNSLCASYEKELLAIIIVTSYAGHDGLRAAHRQAIPQNKLSELGFQRIFLLAELPLKERFINQQQILNEQQKFGDLLQGNFIEAYRNLSYKHIMGLRWAALECTKAKFIIKIDDDVVYDIFQLKNYLEALEVKGYEHNFLAGFILDNKVPIRISANKWYVSEKEYAAKSYPDYLSGWLYITNPSTALRLVRESQQSQFFWIDDTWVTGVLRERIQVSLVRLNSWFSANSEFLDCCVRDLKESNYECEFYVGPNGGDNKLIVEFLHNVEKCYFDECLKRTSENALRQTCVGSAKNLLHDHGEAFVPPPQQHNNKKQAHRQKQILRRQPTVM